MGKRSVRTQNKKKGNLNFTHRELCFDLAEAKGTRFIEVPLGSVWLNRRNGPGQADVLTIKPSYNRFNLDIYEVKVTRSDLLQDIKKGKYKKYLPHCNRLYFAVKQGICTKDDIPEGVGLIVRGENGWSTIRGAEKREIKPSTQMLQALVFYNGRVYNKKRVDLTKRTNVHNTTYFKKDLNFLGKKIAEKLHNYNILRNNYNNLLYEASNKINFPTKEEEEKFLDKWENKQGGVVC